MLFFIALILAGGFVYLAKSAIKKKPYIFYIVALAVTFVFGLVDVRMTPVWFQTYIAGLFTRGAFATALWCVVMWMGALKNGSTLMKMLMPIRGELSILAAILTLGHNIFYGRTYFVMLFTMHERMQTNIFIAALMSVAMLIIMIPLTILSFPQIRRKMKAKLWKRIQRFAYGFYALIYLHVMMLCVPFVKMGREGYSLTLVLYSLVFVSYAVCRVRKALALKAKKNPEKYRLLEGKKLNFGSAGVFVAAMVVAMLIIFLPSGNNANVVTAEETKNRIVMAADSEETTTEKESVTETVNQEETSTQDMSSQETTETEITQETTTLESQTEEQKEEAVADNTQEETQAVQQVTTQMAVQAAASEPVTSEVITEAVTEVATTVAPTTVSYKYKDGTFSGTAYGYDGDITAKVTIKEDVITGITTSSKESDPWWYNQAKDPVVNSIISKQNYKVDAVSGCTYSSEGIMNAVKKALDSAKN